MTIDDLRDFVEQEHNTIPYDIYSNLIDMIDTLRPKGHWIEEFNDMEGEVRFTCTNCRKYQLFETDFCYHCGSDNREVKGLETFDVKEN